MINESVRAQPGSFVRFQFVLFAGFLVTRSKIRDWLREFYVRFLQWRHFVWMTPGL
jgi:hypothetical protein